MPYYEKTYLLNAHQTKTQLGLRNRTIRSIFVVRMKKFVSMAIQYVPREGSDQIARIRRLV